MKRILTYYIIRELSVLFLLGIVIFTLVLLMGRLITLTDLVVSHGVSFIDVISMIMYLIPSFLVFTVPMAFLLAVLLSFGRFSADNEIVVLKASGLSLLQLMPPVFICSLIAVLLALGISTLGVPWGNCAFKELSIKVLKQNLTSTIREKTFWDEIPGIVMYTDHYEGQTQKLKGVIIYDGRNKDRETTIFANEGIVSVVPGSKAFFLTLHNGSMHVPGSGDLYRLIHFGEYILSVSEKGDGAGVAKNVPDMSYTELLGWINNPVTSVASRRKMLTEFHSRFTFPFASLVFAILAVPLGIQNRRSGKSSGFAFSIFIILTYYVLMSLARTLAESGSVIPVLALWTPNLIFFVIGCFLFRRASMEKTLPALPLKRIANYFRSYLE